MNADRRVHARKGAFEIVRYDRAGKWYIEKIASEDGHRNQITLREAVKMATCFLCSGGEVYLGVPGGRSFDARMRPAQ